MPRLGDRVVKVRSKNAGPFWVTVDVFCGTPEVFEQIRSGLRTEAVAALFQQPSQLLKRFDIRDLNVVKFSFPRPVVQGARADGLTVPGRKRVWFLTSVAVDPAWCRHHRRRGRVARPALGQAVGPGCQLAFESGRCLRERPGAEGHDDHG